MIEGSLCVKHCDGFFKSQGIYFQEIIDRLRCKHKYIWLISLPTPHDSDQCQNIWEPCPEVACCKTQICWWNGYDIDWQADETFGNGCDNPITPIHNGSCIHKVPRWFPSKLLEVPFLPCTPVPARPFASQSCFRFEYQQKKHYQYVVWCKKVMDSLMPFHFCPRALLAPPVTERVHSKKISPALFGEVHRRFQHEKKEPIFLHLQPWLNIFGLDFWAVWTKKGRIREWIKHRQVPFWYMVSGRLFNKFQHLGPSCNWKGSHWLAESTELNWWLALWVRVLWLGSLRCWVRVLQPGSLRCWGFKDNIFKLMYKY